MGDPNPFKPLKRTRLPKPGSLPNFGFDVGFVIKDWFFNTDNVRKHLSDVDLDFLRRFGAYTRTVARRSMKRRSPNKFNRKTGQYENQIGKPGYASAPGEPPHAHVFDSTEGGGLRYGPYNIVYGFNPNKRAVVIGPRGKSSTWFKRVPNILEYGGNVRQPTNPRRIARKVGDVGAIRMETPRAGRGGTQRGDNPKKIRAVNGHIYDVFFAKLKSPAMVKRCELIEEFIWGPAKFSSFNIAARPYMRPAFALAQTQIPRFWAEARAAHPAKFTGG